MSEFILSNYDCINLNVFSGITSEISTFHQNYPAESFKEEVPTEESNTDTPAKDSDIYCHRCGRKLKDSQSCIRQMGPTCYKQYQQEKIRRINLLQSVEGNYDE